MAGVSSDSDLTDEEFREDVSSDEVESSGFDQNDDWSHRSFSSDTDMEDEERNTESTLGNLDSSDTDIEEEERNTESTLGNLDSQVIQRQTNGTFSRTWTEYKHGFGDLYGDFWIGNDNLHLLTKTPKFLRVELEGWDGRTASVQYSEFQVANEDQKYKLLVQGFSGDIYDGMKSHNGKLFSTFDQDNDEFGGNCAKNDKGGWWYFACSQADLNGLKYWWYFPRPLIKSRMMIR